MVYAILVLVLVKISVGNGALLIAKVVGTLLWFGNDSKGYRSGSPCMPKKVRGLAKTGRAGGFTVITRLVELVWPPATAEMVEVKTPETCGKPVMRPLVPGATRPDGKPLAP